MAERAAGLKCHVLAANRSPVADPAPAETVFPLAELADRIEGWAVARRMSRFSVASPS